MPGKRKRDEAASNNEDFTAPHNGTLKPLSAIAAARLKAAAPIHNTDGRQQSPPSPLAHSTASEAAESESEDISLVPQNFKLSTWRRNQANVLSDTPEELTIVLDKHATASFVGYFDVIIIKGAVNLNGANLGATTKGSKENAKVYRVIVPSTHPVTKIRGLDRTNHVQLRSCREPTPSANINPLFTDVWGGNVESDRGRSFTAVAESDDDPFKRPLLPENAPEDWLRTIDDITAAPSSTLIAGAPTSGKSTFAKRLLNRYLTGFGKTAKPLPAVCYLDLDPSSPEYTPHGQISLTIVRELNLGPAFAHPTALPGCPDSNNTIAAHVLPHQDLINYEDYFSACAEHLLLTYQTLRVNGPTPPLIVNTPGSLYTSHFPLLQKLVTSTKPTHIVHLGSTTSIDEDTAAKLHALQLQTRKTPSRLHELTAQLPVLPTARTPAELRAMQMASYFHLTGFSTSHHPTHTSSPITTLTPWTFSYAATPTRSQDFFAVLPLFNQAVPPSTLLTALNGTIIHIVTTTSPPGRSSRTPKSHIPYLPSDPATHLPSALAPASTTLVCTALLRSIDPANATFYLLVPPPFESRLSSLDPEKTLLVAGCADTPEWSYTEAAYARVSQRRRDLGDRARFVGDAVLVEGVSKGPWVAEKSVVEGMGYAGAVRRVRKFLG